MLNFSISEIEQVRDHEFGEYDDTVLSFIRKYGNVGIATDYTLLLDNTSPYGDRPDNKRPYWTKSIYQNLKGDKRVYVINANANTEIEYGDIKNIGVRPTIPYSSISSFCKITSTSDTSVEEVEFGEYPQFLVDEEFSSKLEELYNNGLLNKTSKTYTANVFKSSPGIDNRVFEEKKIEEYEYKGRKFVRLVGHPNYNSRGYLSNGKEIEYGKSYWVEVKPITWLVDVEKDVAMSKNILFIGIPWAKDYNSLEFEDSVIKHYLDNYFDREIIPSTIIKKDTTDIVEEKDYRSNYIKEMQFSTKNYDIDVQVKVKVKKRNK